MHFYLKVASRGDGIYRTVWARNRKAFVAGRSVRGRRSKRRMCSSVFSTRLRQFKALGALVPYAANSCSTAATPTAP